MCSHNRCVSGPFILKEMGRLYAEQKKDHEELNELREAVAEAEEAVRKVDELTEENQDLDGKNKAITDNFESERVGLLFQLYTRRYFNLNDLLLPWL